MSNEIQSIFRDYAISQQIDVDMYLNTNYCNEMDDIYYLVSNYYLPEYLKNNDDFLVFIRLLSYTFGKVMNSITSIAKIRKLITLNKNGTGLSREASEAFSRRLSQPIEHLLYLIGVVPKYTKSFDHANSAEPAIFDLSSLLANYFELLRDRGSIKAINNLILLSQRSTDFLNAVDNEKICDLLNVGTMNIALRYRNSLKTLTYESLYETLPAGVRVLFLDSSDNSLYYHVDFSYIIYDVQINSYLSYAILEYGIYADQAIRIDQIAKLPCNTGAIDYGQPEGPQIKYSVSIEPQ